jgi:hypothetical protein
MLMRAGAAGLEFPSKLLVDAFTAPGAGVTTHRDEKFTGLTTI